MIGAPCGVSPAEFALDLDDAPVEALLVALDGCGTFEQRDRLVGTFIPVHLGEPGDHVSGVAAQGLTPGVDPFAVMPSCEFAPPERGGCTKFILAGAVVIGVSCLPEGGLESPQVDVDQRGIDSVAVTDPGHESRFGCASGASENLPDVSDHSMEDHIGAACGQAGPQCLQDRFCCGAVAMTCQIGEQLVGLGSQSFGYGLAADFYARRAE